MKLLVLTYHYFHTDKPTGIKADDIRYSIPLDNLKVRCQQILDYTGEPLEPSRIGKKEAWGINENKIIVTIDDGHQSTLDATEIFLEYGIKPILFVIPDRVGQEHYLNWDQLRSLSDRDCPIQSHSMSHLKLTDLSDEEVTSQLEQSKNIIEDKTGHEVNMLATPMGRINEPIAKRAVELGYSSIMTSFTGINDSINDLIFIKRFQVKQNNMELALRSYFSPFSRVRLEGASKNIIKKLIG